MTYTVGPIPVEDGCPGLPDWGKAGLGLGFRQKNLCIFWQNLHLCFSRRFFFCGLQHNEAAFFETIFSCLRDLWKQCEYLCVFLQPADLEEHKTTLCRIRVNKSRK